MYVPPIWPPDCDEPPGTLPVCEEPIRDLRKNTFCASILKICMYSIVSKIRNTPPIWPPVCEEPPGTLPLWDEPKITRLKNYFNN